MEKPAGAGTVAAGAAAALSEKGFVDELRSSSRLLLVDLLLLMLRLLLLRESASLTDPKKPLRLGLVMAAAMAMCGVVFV